MAELTWKHYPDGGVLDPGLSGEEIVVVWAGSFHVILQSQWIGPGGPAVYPDGAFFRYVLAPEQQFDENGNLMWTSAYRYFVFANGGQTWYQDYGSPSVSIPGRPGVQGELAFINGGLAMCLLGLPYPIQPLSTLHSPPIATDWQYLQG